MHSNWTTKRPAQDGSDAKALADLLCPTQRPQEVRELLDLADLAQSKSKISPTEGAIIWNFFGAACTIARAKIPAQRNIHHKLEEVDPPPKLLLLWTPHSRCAPRHKVALVESSGMGRAGLEPATLGLKGLQNELPQTAEDGKSLQF
jgi:hypothetical protein